ncbi:MAG: HIT family protein [Candidatus Nanohaloarchaea archaeon]
MPQQQECPFCQLIENRDQLLIVDETENFYAWLEINPRARGHTMVVPKEHTETLLDLEPEVYSEGMELARQVALKAEEGLDAEGVSIAANMREAGGQMVPHAYIQVFPRFSDEENAGAPLGAIFPQKEELQDELPEIQEAMKNANPGEETIEPHPESQRFREEPVQTEREQDADEEGRDREPVEWT